MNRTRPQQPPAAVDRKGRQGTRQQILLLYRNAERLQLATDPRADALTVRSQEPGRDPERPGHQRRTRPTLAPILTTTTKNPGQLPTIPGLFRPYKEPVFFLRHNRTEGGKYGTKRT